MAGCVHQHRRPIGSLLRHAEGALAGAVHLLLWTYQAVVSPFLGPACRFVPSCSAYARDALRKHGVARGGCMAVRRVLRCHPWHAGGWDPVA